MKKYFILIIVSLIIGFLLSIYVISQYNNKKSIAVYKYGDLLYVLKYGEYQSKEEMESNTINLENYIYNESDNVYKVYIGITKLKDNIDKMKKYYNQYKVEVENFYITNDDFINKVESLDNILKNTDDSVVIGEIINQQLSSYDEVVIHGYKD